LEDYFVNKNNYGLILLRNSLDEALAESEEMYDRECERKGCKTPKAQRGTSYLLGIKEHVLSGQVGLHIPAGKHHIEVPIESIKGEHVDNPFWVNYEWINGEPKFVLGALPFGFGFGVVDPIETKKILEGNFSNELISQVRESTRKYTLAVHSRASLLIQEFLKKSEIKQRILEHVNAELFEELVADLLRNQGFDVFLTSRTRDGGKDIWASTVYEKQRVTALVECKMRSATNAIDPAIARAVVGTYFIERNKGIDVDCAIMVTSSDNIGPETLAIQQQMREFTVKDCNDVVKWIESYGAIRNGLWVPDALSHYLQ
jgi:hypothetical protein